MVEEKEGEEVRELRERGREGEVMMWTRPRPRLRPPSSTAGYYQILELLGSAAQTSDGATPRMVRHFFLPTEHIHIQAHEGGAAAGEFGELGSSATSGVHPCGGLEIIFILVMELAARMMGGGRGEMIIRRVVGSEL